jgi:outer membrane protein insertion porin family
MAAVGLLVHWAVFNNFRHETCLIRKRINLPMGDGQKVSLTTSEYIFWLTAFRFQNRGLDKPVQFSSSISYSKQFLNDFRTQRVDKTKSFNLVSVGLARRLTVPDDFFVLSQSLSYQHYDLNNTIQDYLLLGTVHQET